MLSTLTKKAGQLIADNAETILTAGGVIGTVTTAVLTARSTFQAADAITNEVEASVGVESKNDLSKTDKIKLVWPLYLPPVATGAATVGCILYAHRLNAQNAAALAAAYTATQKQRDEYKAKVQEKLGLKKEEAITDDLQQDRINRKPPPQTVIIGQGPVLCYDAFSDRYFQSSAESIRKAEKAVQAMVETRNEACLRDFYDELELPHTQYDDMLGWNLSHPPKVQISAMMVNDNDACLCIEFNNLPMHNFGFDYD